MAGAKVEQSVDSRLERGLHGRGSMAMLKDDAALERSEVVANAAMNRERGLAGVNSYTRDLGLDPYAFLEERLRSQEHVAWLDLCCGTGRALVQAAARFSAQGLDGRVALVGIDLVPVFDRSTVGRRSVRLVEGSVTAWEPGQEEAFDLVTCVHGLHYVGDKLRAIVRAAGWLAEDGLFIAHLDPANLRTADGSELGPPALRALRQSGLRFDRRRRLLTCRGRREVALGLRYVGADDAAGPNFTGQPAVNSFYECARPGG